MEPPKPKVGVGLLLIKDNKILLGKRIHKGKHGFGEFAGLGGHMELGETFEEAIIREAAEEMGAHVKFKNLKFLCLTNILKYMPKHYIDIGMVADWVSGEPKVMEPDKLESWKWYPLNKLPKPLFAAEPNYIEAYKTGKVYFSE